MEAIPEVLQVIGDDDLCGEYCLLRARVPEWHNIERPEFRLFLRHDHWCIVHSERDAVQARSIQRDFCGTDPLELSGGWYKWDYEKTVGTGSHGWVRAPQLEVKAGNHSKKRVLTVDVDPVDPDGRATITFTSMIGETVASVHGSVGEITVSRLFELAAEQTQTPVYSLGLAMRDGHCLSADESGALLSDYFCRSGSGGLRH